MGVPQQVPSTASYNTAPLYQITRVRGNEITFLIDGNPSTTTWRLYKRTSITPDIVLVVPSSGFNSPHVLGNISYVTAKELRISLDRSIDWYLQYQCDGGNWSEKQYIDLRTRNIARASRLEAVVKDTNSGAVVFKNNPKIIETKIETGVSVTPEIYIDEPETGESVETKTNRGATIINNAQTRSTISIPFEIPSVSESIIPITVVSATVVDGVYIDMVFSHDVSTTSLADNSILFTDGDETLTPFASAHFRDKTIRFVVIYRISLTNWIFTKTPTSLIAPSGYEITAPASGTVICS